jgi:hypothetical protein
MLTGRGDFAAVYGLPIRQKVELPGRMVYNRSIPYGAEAILEKRRRTTDEPNI